jgi:hypothetical protein
VRQSPGGDLAQAVLLADALDLDDDVTHGAEHGARSMEREREARL